MVDDAARAGAGVGLLGAERGAARRELARALLRSKTFLVGSVIVGYWVFWALVGARLTPYDPFLDTDQVVRAPSLDHWFGTDQLGRDIFSRVHAGAADILSAAPLATMLGLAGGTAVGLIIGYFAGSAIEEAAGRVIDAVLGLPVLVLTIVLPTAVFRSLLIPAVTALMNLLTAGACFGLVTAVFQWGWAASLLGIGKTGPIEPFIPVMMFAIVFGLSMDYQVFFVSRIYEEWHRRGDNRAAVTHGLAATGRTITAAAAIMVLVFGAFMLGGERVIVLFGLGLAGAVFLDALVVRSVLVPGLMLLAGKANWWLPRSLDRLLPHLNVEGGVHHDGQRRKPAPHPILRPAPRPLLEDTAA